MDYDYYIRQTGLIDPAKLDKTITVIGAGGIGSWTALALAKMGCQNVQVIDFDVIEKHNVGSQLYGALDIDKKKVDAVKDRITPLVDNVPHVRDEEITPENIYVLLRNTDILISAVDVMSVRRMLFEWLAVQNDVHFIDGRMAANAIEIYTAHSNDRDSLEAYDKTLFSDEDALPIACSMRAVIYNTFVVSGLITAMVAQIANGKDLKRETVVDLTNLSMFSE